MIAVSFRAKSIWHNKDTPDKQQPMPEADNVVLLKSDGSKQNEHQ